MPPQATPLRLITKGHHHARILWRKFLATDDSRADEGHVRELSTDGAWVRIAYSTHPDENGEWYRVSDLRLIEVLQTNVPLKEKKKRKPRRIEGDEWKDADSDDFDFGSGGPDA